MRQESSSVPPSLALGGVGGEGGASFTPSSSAELLKTTTVTLSTAASGRHPLLAWLVPLEGRETHPEKRVS